MKHVGLADGRCMKEKRSRAQQRQKGFVWAQGAVPAATGHCLLRLLRYSEEGACNERVDRRSQPLVQRTVTRGHR